MVRPRGVHLGLLGVAVPAAFCGNRFGSSSRRVMSATMSPCGTVVALDSSIP